MAKFGVFENKQKSTQSLWCKSQERKEKTKCDKKNEGGRNRRKENGGKRKKKTTQKRRRSRLKPRNEGIVAGFVPSNLVLVGN